MSRAEEGIVRIEHLADPRVADYREVRDADLIRARGLFIAEGTEVVRTLFARSRYRPRSILIAEKHLTSGAFDDVLENARGRVPIYVAPADVLSAIAGFDLHRGCLAAGERGPLPAAEALLQEGGEVILVLEGISNHDNIGALFRNAAAFGVRALFLDPTCADPLYRKSIRVSMGHALVLPFARLDPWPGALDLFEQSGFELCALTPCATASPLGSTRPPKIALLAGTEGRGLSAEALQRARTQLRIPMAASVDSINVATAVAIALYVLTT